MTNLVEGALVVFIVLVVFLGSIRGALVCVIGIPASMTIALFGMHWAGVTGDLMSLGAIDFGFLVDGPIVVLEALLATYIGKQLTVDERVEAYIATIQRVIRPVAFAVAIIMLVYVPLLGLEGVEGRMFRPMATTMAFALLGALIYSVLFLPALLATFVPPMKKDGARWLRPIGRLYGRMVPGALRLRWPLIFAAAAALVVSAYVFKNKGANFVPRIDEGDAVVTIRRAPSINLEEAKRLDLMVQKTLFQFPEVITTLAMTGRAEVAIDPVGKDTNDTFVRLKPKKEWTTAHDLDGLSVAFKDALEREVPSTFFSISQPIEDRTNEMISGSRADVQIMITGADLLELKRVSETIRDAVKGIEGTGDVRVERVLGMPELTVKPDRARLARYGVHMEDALLAIEAARVGMPLGWVYEGQKRFETRLLVPPRAPVPEALGDLLVETDNGNRVPLSEVATITESEGPAQIRRENRVRIVRVEVNLRGRDLLSWVTDAQAAVAKDVVMPSGYEIQWSGQFENFERASKRLAVVVPIALALIFGMLMWNFGDFRYAVSVFAVVPFALTGGMVGLILRDMEFSIPAAVGFIALAGVAVLNGVVLATDVRHALHEGGDFDTALVKGSVHTMRAVLTTGAVAALGFLPMALATGAGSEVQRPLATTVVFGIGASTLMTMFLLPAILKITLRREQKASRAAAHRPTPSRSRPASERPARDTRRAGHPGSRLRLLGHRHDRLRHRLTAPRRSVTRATLREDRRRHRTQVPDQTHRRERPQHVVGDVELPPVKPLPRRAHVVVMVVVPPLTEGDKRDPPAVARRVARVEAPLPGHVRQRVHEEGDVPAQHRAQAKPDEQPRPAEQPPRRHAQQHRRHQPELVEQHQLRILRQVLDLRIIRVLGPAVHQPQHVRVPKPLLDR
jgi:cobalt-zinc-cadmium resistance protein CzcA